MKKQSTIKKMALSALFAALVCISTMIAPIQLATGGYIHLGDAFVLLAGFILGPLWGGAAAAIGSALTDLFYGAFHYVPATFVIKGLVAAAAYLVAHALRGTRVRRSLLCYAVGGAVGELIMAAGYFAYESVIYTVSGAAAAVPLNLLQAVSGVILSLLLIGPLMRIKYISEIVGEQPRRDG